MSASPLELERALVRELSSTYDKLNASLFRRSLGRPSIELSDTRGRLGRYVPDCRLLELSRPLLLEKPWGIVVEVLKHEMAHQYVYEVLGAHDESPHGDAFRRVCAERGIDARAEGLPKSTPDENRIIARIQKLLSLAESPNPHEAEAAALAAQKLMLKHNLSAPMDRDYGFRHVGRVTGRTTPSERMLALLLADHFFVEILWVPAFRPRDGIRGSVLEICGTEVNLNMAEYVHGFLTHAAERLWDLHKKETGQKGDRKRRHFLAGVMSGVREKLAAQKKVHAREGLVWIRDANLHGYFRRRHPHIVNVGYRTRAARDGFEEGQRVGRTLVIHKPLEEGPRGVRGLLGA